MVECPCFSGRRPSQPTGKPAILAVCTHYRFDRRRWLALAGVGICQGLISLKR